MDFGLTLQTDPPASRLIELFRRAEGLGFTRIAKALNEDEVAPDRRANGWGPPAVREILRRPLY